MSDAPKPGHGDHWLAVLDEGDPRLRDVIGAPADARDGLELRRTPLTGAVDLVQVTLRRRLVTAYPEPRATVPVRLRPRELALWETRVEGWLVGDHEGAGTLTVFVTDLAESAHRYAQAAAGTRDGIEVELGAIAYLAHRAPLAGGPARLQPAGPTDARFLPDDYAFDGEVLDVRDAADGGEVLDLGFQGGLEVPVATRSRTGAHPGERVQGYLWLTARLPPSR